MIAKLTPVESFLFRNNKPFGVSDNTAVSVFPPSPSTLYGAARTSVIQTKDCLQEFLNDANDKLEKELREELGTKSQPGSFKIKAITLLEDNDGERKFYFPTPRDILGKAKSVGSDRTMSILTQWDCYDDIAVRDSINPLYTTKKGFSYANNSWIGSLEEYLLGNYADIELKLQSDFLVEEPHTGIAIDSKTRTVEDGMLFTQQRLRMKKGFSLAFEYNSLTDLNKVNIFTLGQDKRVFHHEVLDLSLMKDITADLKRGIETNNGYFKIYFSSPIMFTAGTYPGSYDDSTKEWRVNDNLLITIDTVIGGRPLYIGGWDMNLRRPKKVMKYHPSGTLFYCQLKDLSQLDNLINTIHRNNICDDKSLNQQGFGHAFLALQPNKIENGEI